MRGGDISNEVPMRVAVNLECLLQREVKISKVLGIPVPKEEVRYNLQALSQFWRFRERNDYVMELVGFGYSQKEMDEVQEDLDNLGTNPFNYVKAYNTISELVAELPYRPELKYVIDRSENGLRYGHWYLEEGAVYGGQQ